MSFTLHRMVPRARRKCSGRMKQAEPQITLQPFSPQDVAEFTEQGAMKQLREVVSEAQANALAKYESWTARVDGQIVMIFGIAPIWENRAMVWCYQPDENAHFDELTKAMGQTINASTYGRIEMYLYEHADTARRRAEMLEFINETPDGPMEAFLPCGTAAYLYAKVK